MTRKRGKSRTSSGEKRGERYKKKYSLGTLTKRAKKLLPIMYPNIEIELINWDFLEYLVYPKMDDLGIPEEEQPNYMAWVKRKAELGLMFQGNTRTAEYLILKAEFVARGLDGDWLDALEPLVDDWVDYFWGRGTMEVIFEEVSVDLNIAEATETLSENLEFGLGAEATETMTEEPSVEQNINESTETISESVEVELV